MCFMDIWGIWGYFALWCLVIDTIVSGLPVHVDVVVSYLSLSCACFST